MSEITKYLGSLMPHKVEKRLRSFRDRYLRNYNTEPLPAEMWDNDLRYYKISLCTNCMNRIFHLKQTLETNIQNNRDYPEVEFVLVNYNSQDGMHDWVRQNLMKYIASGHLNYYYTRDPQYFHMSKAKNLAHRLARGDILCNLDGDNYTGKHFARYINYLFNIYGDNFIFHFKKAPYWGTEGRIVLSRQKFYRLGGYDESFYPTGHQDHDLIARAKLSGMKYKNIRIENFLRYLSNSRREKSSGLGDKMGDYYWYRDHNRKKSMENLDNGRLVANIQNGWGNALVYRNFENRPIRTNSMFQLTNNNAGHSSEPID